MFIYDVKYTGVSAEEKLNRLYDWMNKNKRNKIIINDKEEVAWLLNLRKNNKDVIVENDAYIYSPVFMCSLEIDIEKGKNTLKLEERPSEEIVKYLEDLNIGVVCTEEIKIEVEDDSAQRTIISDWKAIKNETEIKSMKEAHKKDGHAMIQFIYWMKHNDMRKNTELDVMDKLEEIRSKKDNYFMPSFRTIAGYNEHGASIHYEATEESNVYLENCGLIVVDAGGQYIEGTTDTTRTIIPGSLHMEDKCAKENVCYVANNTENTGDIVTDEMKQMYTAVLKGHIGVATARFKDGTTGDVLDEIARKPLRDLGLDYNHGTGHGVGCLLGVHEHPRRVFHKDTVLKEGLITSNEPGVYLDGKFGVRIENVVVVKRMDDGLLGFENLTMCPYEYDLVDWSMLEKWEIDYLKKYQKHLVESYESYLSSEELEWMKGELKKIKVD